MSLTWNAQLLRVTLFLTPPVDGSGLWQAVVGEAPEVDEHRPREGVRRQAGKVGDALLEMGMTADRLDWVMSPAVEVPIPDPAYHLGDPQTAVDTFDKFLAPWLARSDFPVLRIAFGLIAVSPEPDRVSSYARLQELVPSVKYDAERTREVLYQVNRPVQSELLAGFELNRITKWSAARFVTQNIALSGGSLVATAGAETHFARCECDHSTPADRTQVFPADQLVAIYQRLRDLAMLNLERGELG